MFLLFSSLAAALKCLGPQETPAGAFGSKVRLQWPPAASCQSGDAARRAALCPLGVKCHQSRSGHVARTHRVLGRPGLRLRQTGGSPRTGASAAPASPRARNPRHGPQQPPCTRKPGELPRRAGTWCTTGRRGWLLPPTKAPPLLGAPPPSRLPLRGPETTPLRLVPVAAEALSAR